jgi:hypothetical protein
LSWSINLSFDKFNSQVSDDLPVVSKELFAKCFQKSDQSPEILSLSVKSFLYTEITLPFLRRLSVTEWYFIHSSKQTNKIGFHKMAGGRLIKRLHAKTTTSDGSVDSAPAAETAGSYLRSQNDNLYFHCALSGFQAQKDKTSFSNYFSCSYALKLLKKILKTYHNVV